MTAPYPLANPPPMKVIRVQRCENCKFAEVSGNSLICRRNPPVVGFIGIRNGAVQTASACPTVQGDHWCGEWKTKIEGVN